MQRLGQKRSPLGTDGRVRQVQTSHASVEGPVPSRGVTRRDQNLRQARLEGTRAASFPRVGPLGGVLRGRATRSGYGVAVANSRRRILHRVPLSPKRAHRVRILVASRFARRVDSPATLPGTFRLGRQVVSLATLPGTFRGARDGFRGGFSGVARTRDVQLTRPRRGVDVDVDVGVGVDVGVNLVLASSGSLALSAGFLLQGGQGRVRGEETAREEVHAAVDASAARV